MRYILIAFIVLFRAELFAGVRFVAPPGFDGHMLIEPLQDRGFDGRVKTIDEEERRAALRGKINEAARYWPNVLRIVKEILDSPDLKPIDLMLLIGDSSGVIAKYARIAYVVGSVIRSNVFFKRRRPESGFLSLEERNRLAIAILMPANRWYVGKTAEKFGKFVSSLGVLVRRYNLRKPDVIRKDRENKVDCIVIGLEEMESLNADNVEKAAYLEAIEKFGRNAELISINLKVSLKIARQKLDKYAEHQPKQGADDTEKLINNINGTDVVPSVLGLLLRDSGNTAAHKRNIGIPRTTVLKSQ